MGIFDKLLRRETPQTTSNIIEPSDALLRALLSGEEVNRESAMSVPAVAAAVDRIANVVGMLPVRLYQESSAGEDRRKVTEIHGDSRTKLLNVDTADLLDTFQFKKAMATDYLIDRGAFAVIKKQRVDWVGLHHVDPGFVTYYKNTDPVYKTASYQIGNNRYQPHEMIIMLRQTRDGVSGVSIIEEVRRALSTAVESMAFELGLVRKGGSKKGFLESDKILEQKQMDALRAAWKKLYSNDEENIVILNNGVKFKEAAATSVELQLNERKKQLAEEINGIFHVSDDYDKMVKEAVMPVLNAFEAALSRNLLTEEEKANGYYFRFDTKEITKGDIKTRYDAYKTATEAGYLTKNEIRYMEDLDPIDGLDVVGLGLGDVLYNTKTGEYYTPNTGETKKLDGSTPATPGAEPFARSKRVAEQGPIAAGLCVVAEDTGRVLMLQRADDEEDPAAGTWEFPGGHIDDGENSLAAAFREWAEEVGRRVPAGKVLGEWRSEDGKYVGFVWSIHKEAIIKLDSRTDITNPDDPDGDIIEAIAWFDMAHVEGNPAIRPKLASSIEQVKAAVGAEQEQ